MANVGMQQGILMYKGKRMMSLESDIDLSHLMAIKAPDDVTDLGTVELWAQKRRAEVPWLQIDGLNNPANIQFTGKWAKYNTPTKRDGSTYIVEDLSFGVDAGRGGTPVEMEIRGRHMSIGEMFKFGNELSVPEYRVQSIERDAGDNQVISFTRTDSEDPIDRTFIMKGGKIVSMRVNIFAPEFDQDYGKWAVDISSGPEYRFPVGQAEIRVEYHVTKEVAKIDLGYKQLQIDGAMKKYMDDAVEYYFQIPGISSDDKIQTLSQALATPSMAPMVTDAMKNQKVPVKIASLYDSLSVRYLNMGQNFYTMWGTGGRQSQGKSYDEFWLPVGIWQQLDTGYKFRFNIATFGLHTLKEMYRQFMHGKMDIPAEGAEPTLIVRTGLGGYQLIQQMIEQQRNNSAVVVMATDFNQIKGAGPSGLEYSPLSYSAIRVPFLAVFKFEYDASFDTITDDPISNPYIPGYGERLSSYSMIIMPENALGSGNIQMLRNQDDKGQIFMNIENGRGVGHPLYSTSFNTNGIKVTQSSSKQTGYTASFYKSIDSARVVDPTKVLKAVPINPFTGLTF